MNSYHSLVFHDTLQDYPKIYVQVFTSVHFLSGFATKVLCVGLMRTVCNICSHRHSNNNIQRKYTFYFMIFRLIRQFSRTLFFFLPLDSNIPLEDFFSKTLLSYKLKTFCLCHILFGIIYFLVFVHCIVLNITIPRFRDRIIPPHAVF